MRGGVGAVLFRAVIEVVAGLRLVYTRAARRDGVPR